MRGMGPFEKAKKHIPWVSEVVAFSHVMELDKISSFQYLFLLKSTFSPPDSYVLTNDQTT